MERHARLILVSTFLLLSIAALIGFYQWIAGPDEGDMSAEQAIQFDGSVSGLSVGSDVRYLGVPVGRVNSIRLSPGTPGRVDVVIGLDQALPGADTLVAMLEAQGITGLSIIELRDRTDDLPGFDVPQGTIPGYPSLLGQLSSSAARVAGSLEATLQKLDRLISDQAVDDLAATLGQLRILSTNLASASADIDHLMASASRVSGQIEETLPDFRAAAQKLDREVLPAIAEAGQSMRSMTEAVNASIGENGQVLGELLNRDLPTLIGMTDELANTLQEFNALVGNINDEPGALLYGEQVREVEIPRD